MILGINHVQITAPSDRVDAAHGFYRGILGLTEIEKPSELKSRRGLASS
jgi:catechol 2,3-dioxygenase-like lactoylglutathione lyase family enzyme